MPRSFIWVILFILLWMAMRILNSKTGSQAQKTALRITIFYTISSILGYFFKNWGTVRTVWNTRNDALNFACFWIGFFCIVFCFLLLLIMLLDKNHPDLSRSGRPGSRFYLIMMGLLLTAWLPWFLTQCPGITTPDSDNQIRQVMGDLPLSDNHPLLHTLWIRLMFAIGGTPQNGVFLYSVLQLLFSAAVFADCICFIEACCSNRSITAAAALWFAFYPVYPLYGMTLWKDVPFALFLLLIAINLCRIIREGNEHLQARLLLLNAFLFLVLCFLRHNGILVFIPAFIILLIKFKHQRKTYLPACLAVIMIYAVFKLLLIPAFGIKAGRGSEGFSIPLQQIARVASKHRNSLTDEQKETLVRFFNGKDLSELYTPTLSDPVKRNFSEDEYSRDPGSFLRLWWELGKTYPGDYLESILHNSFGFFYPEADHMTFVFGQDTPNLYGIHEAPILNSAIMNGLQNYFESMKYYSAAVFSWLFAPALSVWILFFAFRYSRYRKSEYWIIHIPLISLWLQMFGSPAFAEFRYVYGLFTCLPLVLCCSLFPPCVTGNGSCMD